MTDPDHQTIRRVLDGDTRAYAALVDRHKAHGMALAMRMLKHREEAEEALQDAFVRAYRGLARFEFQAKFSTWLYRILYNVCSTRLQSRHAPEISLDATSEETAPLSLATSDPSPDLDLESREFRNIVAEEIAALPPNYSGVLTLFLLEDLSYQEIVEITGMPLGTVKTQLFRARTLLRRNVLRRMR